MNLLKWINPVNTNEPDIVGLHFNGNWWEYGYLPEGIYPCYGSVCADYCIRIWFHPLEWE